MPHIKRVKIDHRNTSMSHLQFEEALRKHHYHRHGAGAYARTYIDHGRTHIIKVGDYDVNHSYMDFVAYARAYPRNPWLPRISDAAVYYPYGQEDAIAERPFIYVAMEVLHCIREASFDRYSDPLESPKQFINLQKCGLIKMDKHFTLALQILQKLDLKGHQPDLHSGNVMLRGKQVVITDPVVD